MTPIRVIGSRRAGERLERAGTGRRRRENQLIVVPAGQKTVKERRILFEGDSRRVRQRHGLGGDLRPETGAFADMAEIRDKAVGDVQTGGRSFNKPGPTARRGCGRR